MDEWLHPTEHNALWGVITYPCRSYRLWQKRSSHKISEMLVPIDYLISMALVQYCGNPSVLAMELLQFCVRPLIHSAPSTKLIKDYQNTYQHVLLKYHTFPKKMLCYICRAFIFLEKINDQTFDSYAHNTSTQSETCDHTPWICP